MNVKRYNQEYYHSGDESTLDEAPDGEWVRWEDVEALTAVMRDALDIRKTVILRLRDAIRAMRHAPPTEEHRNWVALMDGTPDGTRPMPVYLVGDTVIICGDPPDEPNDGSEPDHNCDEMGCTSGSHVLWRGPRAAWGKMCCDAASDAVEFQTQERDGLRALLREMLEAEIEDANNWGRCFEMDRETCARIEKAVKVDE